MVEEAVDFLEEDNSLQGLFFGSVKEVSKASPAVSIVSHTILSHTILQYHAHTVTTYHTILQ